MPLKSLDKVLLDELKDLYSAENQILKALPKMAKAASSPLLKEAFTMHLEQTRGQVDRLDQVARLMGEKSFKGKKCKAMEGLLEEGQELIEEGGDPAVLDAAMIGAAQKVEHYEMAGYGTARTHARHLGLEQVARLLQETLDEEGQTDKNLTKIAQRKINLDAKAEGEDGRGGRKGAVKGSAKGAAKRTARGAVKGAAKKAAGARGAAGRGATKSAAGGSRAGAAKGGSRAGATRSGAAKGGASSGARGGTRGGSTSGMSRGGRAGAGSVAGKSRTAARSGAGTIARSAASTRAAMPGPGVTTQSLPARTGRAGGAAKATRGGGSATGRNTRTTPRGDGAATARGAASPPAGATKAAPGGRTGARGTSSGGGEKAAPSGRPSAARATPARGDTTKAPGGSASTTGTSFSGAAAPASGILPPRTAPGGDVGQGRFGGGGGGGDASLNEIERAGLGPDDIDQTIEEIRSGEILGGFSGAEDFDSGAGASRGDEANVGGFDADMDEGAGGGASSDERMNNGTPDSGS